MERMELKILSMVVKTGRTRYNQPIILGRFSMRSLSLLAAALLLTSTFVSVSASAFSVDEVGNSKNAANFNDPDDKIPYPHIADDGKPSNNFQGKQVGNGSVTFGFTSSAPSSSNEPSAFERAQQRMQQ